MSDGCRSELVRGHIYVFRPTKRSWHFNRPANNIVDFFFLRLWLVNYEPVLVS